MSRFAHGFQTIEWLLHSEWQSLTEFLIQDLWYLVFEYHDFHENPACSCHPQPELYTRLLEFHWLPKHIWHQVSEFCDFDWINQTERFCLDPWRGHSAAEYTCHRFGHRIRLEVRGYQYCPVPLLNPPCPDPQVFGPQLPGWDQSLPVEPIHLDDLYCWKIIASHNLLHPNLDPVMTELGFRVRHSPDCYLVNQGYQPSHHSQVLLR